LLSAVLSQRGNEHVRRLNALQMHSCMIHNVTASISAGKAQHPADINWGLTCFRRCLLQACCLPSGPVCHMLAFCLQRKLQPMPKSVLRRHVNGLTTGRANSERGSMKCGAVSLRSCTTRLRRKFAFLTLASKLKSSNQEAAQQSSRASTGVRLECLGLFNIAAVFYNLTVYNVLPCTAILWVLSCLGHLHVEQPTRV